MDTKLCSICGAVEIPGTICTHTFPCEKCDTSKHDGRLIPIDRDGNCLTCGKPVRNKQRFWDSQAARGELSGTQDRYAKELEMQTISHYVRDGMRVLDVGCGDGETVLFLADKYPHLVIDGIDYSEEMISNARQKRGFTDRMITFCRQDIRDGVGDLGDYDLVYTQRALINLDTWEEQRTAILDILSLLKPGGKYVMVECFVEGLDEINDLRQRVGLETIVPPWHNRYLKRDEVYAFCDELFFKEGY